MLADRSIGPYRTDQEIAEVLLCSQATVGNIRKRFLKEGLQAALSEKARPGRTPKSTGEIEAQMVLRACSDPPQGQARWTVRLLTSRLRELGGGNRSTTRPFGNGLKQRT